MNRNFMELLRAKWAEDKFVCVGLDIDFTKIPVGFLDNHQSFSKAHAMEIYLKRVVDQTKDLVCSYKPNSAFYEAIGEPGYELLEHIISYINEKAPDVPVILDGKRADIGNTNKGYATAIFDQLKADAVTVHPYLGSEAMKPFLDYQEKGIIVLCRTSNDGAGEFQDLPIAIDDDMRTSEMRESMSHSKPLYEIVAVIVRDKWNYNGNCLLVAGATYPEDLGRIRSIVGDMPLLIPGVGTQGGEVMKVIENGLDSKGRGIIINSSSGIIFAKNPGEACLKLHNEITECRKKVMELRAQAVH